MFIYWFVFPEFNVLYDDDAPAAVATDDDGSIFFIKTCGCHYIECKELNFLRVSYL